MLSSGLMLVAAMLLCSCHSPQMAERCTPPYQPKNFVITDVPAKLQRVAVLPLAPTPSQGEGVLSQIFADELTKSGVFEVVLVSPAQLMQWTGSERWASYDRLPRDLFGAVAEHTGCDAVMFIGVTQFRAYPPLALGWKSQLVDAKSQQTIWAADEVFDAGRPDVKHAYRNYAETHLIADARLADYVQIDSPQRFGRYSAQAVISTLPGHKISKADAK